jgi:hypothetical protein
MLSEEFHMDSKRLLLAALASVCIAPSTNAQDKPETLDAETIERLNRSSYVHVNGKENPDLVPFRIRMKYLFNFLAIGVFKDELDDFLSPADLRVLTSYAEKHKGDFKQDDQEYRKAWMAMAAQAQHMSAGEIAAATKAIADRSHARREQRYRTVLAQLSERGRQELEQFVYLRIRPSFSEYDPFVIANAAPEHFKAQVVGVYELARDGKIPLPPPDAPQGVSNSSQSVEGELTSDP